MLEYLYPLLQEIDNETIAFEQIVLKIKMMEDITKDNLPWYLEAMEEITGKIQCIQVHREDSAAMEVAKEIIADAAFLSLENETLNIAERTKTLEYQLRMILFGFSLRKTDESIDCDPELRQKHADRLLELYQLIMNQVEEDYDPNDEHAPRFKIFFPQTLSAFTHFTAVSAALYKTVLGVPRPP